MARTDGQSAARAFLGAALSPGVQAATRWICVNARTRRAFALSGKDSGASLLHWLAAGRPREDGGERYTAAAARLGIDEGIGGTSFLGWYRCLNDGYPFVDYATEAGRKADARLMAAYAARSGAPPPSTPHAGRRQALPAGRLRHTGGPQPPDLELLAGWLRVAAGFTAVREISTATVALRTSPSGGARHPTDLALRPGPGWGEDLAASWWYDPLEHALVPSEWALPGAPGRHGYDDGVVFAVTSHVERAMWRYRDVRAFRPVLIDAGHVVETLMTTVESTGWTALWHPAPGAVEVEGQLDPVFGYVTATPEPPEPGAREFPCEPWTVPPAPGAVAFRTNPLISLTVTGSGLRAENHLAGGRAVDVTPAMVDALAYATPSSRRDRPTAPDALAAATSLDATGLGLLASRGLLLEEAAGDRLWRLARPWFAHDWFLSLLAHAEEASGRDGGLQPGAAPPPAAVPSRHAVAVPADLPRALDGRRTCRALSGAALPPRALERVLEAAALAGEHVRVLLLLRHPGSSLPEGMYVQEEGTWRPTDLAVPSEEDITAAAIGQPWARGFSAVVWLVPCPDAAPGSWEQALVECGRAAQRVTLAVSGDEAVGVFQSPALLDERLGGMLAGQRSPDGVYLVGIGVAADAPARRPWRFRPSDLYAPEAGA